jgi:hypothetical protein
MPPGLARIEATLPQAQHAISVTENGQHLGTVALVLVQRPHGATLRRQWWAQPPANDPRPIPRPFDTRAGAISCLRYRHATLNRAEPGPAPDATLHVIAAALVNAGPTAAVWLAASLALHHIAELEAQRRSDPPAIWRELRRIGDWLKAATDPNPLTSSASGVDYRRSDKAEQLVGVAFLGPVRASGGPTAAECLLAPMAAPDEHDRSRVAVRCPPVPWVGKATVRQRDCRDRLMALLPTLVGQHPDISARLT